MSMEPNLTDTERETSVLFVDPNGTAHRSLSLRVRNGKYRIKASDSVDAALELLAREPFDIVLIDGGAGETSAMEAVKRIRLGCPYTEVIVLTESSNDPMAVQALGLGLLSVEGRETDWRIRIQR